jgi:peptidoglycan/LPS O-acetylase OafA/YrhL
MNQSAVRTRDAWLDAMRTVSIARVVLIHTFMRIGEAAIIPLSFVLPGMPIVFVVSGALAFAALTRDVGTAAGSGAVGRFYRDRARRLFVPFWFYSALVVTLLHLSAARTDHRWHHFEFSALWRFLVPYADPVASPAWKHLALHLWFVPPFFWLLLAAPLLVAIQRRWFGLGLVVTFAAAAAIELGRIDAPGTVRNVLVYGVAFQLGFLLRDPNARRPAWWLLFGAGALSVTLGILLHHAHAPGQLLNTIPFSHLLVAIGVLPLWIALRGVVERVMTTPAVAALSQAVNSRAYTIFLYGPAANEVAWRIAAKLPEQWFVSVYLALSFAVLVAFARFFGQVEGWRSRRTSP